MASLKKKNLFSKLKKRNKDYNQADEHHIEENSLNENFNIETFNSNLSEEEKDNKKLIHNSLKNKKIDSTHNSHSVETVNKLVSGIGNLITKANINEKIPIHINFERFYQELFTNYTKCNFIKVIEDINEKLEIYSNSSNRWVLYELYLLSYIKYIKRQSIKNKKSPNMNTEKKIIQGLEKLYLFINKWSKELKRIDHSKDFNLSGIFKISKYLEYLKFIENYKIKEMYDINAFLAKKDNVDDKNSIDNDLEEKTKIVSKKNLQEICKNKELNRNNSIVDIKGLTFPREYNIISKSFYYQKEMIFYFKLNLIYYTALYYFNQAFFSEAFDSLIQINELIQDYIDYQKECEDLFDSNSNIYPKCLPNTYSIICQIYLLLSYVLYINKNFKNSLIYADISLRFSTKEIFYREFNNDSNIYYDTPNGLIKDMIRNNNYHIKEKHKYTKLMHFNIVIAFYIKGTCYENFGEHKEEILKAIENYKQATWFASKFVENSNQIFYQFIKDVQAKIIEKYFLFQTKDLFNLINAEKYQNEISNLKKKSLIKSISNENKSFLDQLNEKKELYNEILISKIKKFKYNEPLENPFQYSEAIELYKNSNNKITSEFINFNINNKYQISKKLMEKYKNYNINKEETLDNLKVENIKNQNKSTEDTIKQKNHDHINLSKNKEQVHSSRKESLNDNNNNNISKSSEKKGNNDFFTLKDFLKHTHQEVRFDVFNTVFINNKGSNIDNNLYFQENDHLKIRELSTSTYRLLQLLTSNRYKSLLSKIDIKKKSIFKFKKNIQFKISNKVLKENYLLRAKKRKTLFKKMEKRKKIIKMFKEKMMKEIMKPNNLIKNIIKLYFDENDEYYDTIMKSLEQFIKQKEKSILSQNKKESELIDNQQTELKNSKNPKNTQNQKVKEKGLRHILLNSSSAKSIRKNIKDESISQISSSERNPDRYPKAKLKRKIVEEFDDDNLFLFQTRNKEKIKMHQDLLAINYIISQKQEIINELNSKGIDFYKIVSEQSNIEKENDITMHSSKLLNDRNDRNDKNDRYDKRSSKRHLTSIQSLKFKSNNLLKEYKAIKFDNNFKQSIFNFSRDSSINYDDTNQNNLELANKINYDTKVQSTISSKFRNNHRNQTSIEKSVSKILNDSFKECNKDKDFSDKKEFSIHDTGNLESNISKRSNKSKKNNEIDNSTKFNEVILTEENNNVDENLKNKINEFIKQKNANRFKNRPTTSNLMISRNNLTQNIGNSVISKKLENTLENNTNNFENSTKETKMRNSLIISSLSSNLFSFGNKDTKKNSDVKITNIEDKGKIDIKADKNVLKTEKNEEDKKKYEIKLTKSIIEKEKIKEKSNDELHFFSKAYIEKINYLNKFETKEIEFQKKILELKASDLIYYETFNSSKVKKNCLNFFQRNFNIQSSRINSSKLPQNSLNSKINKHDMKINRLENAVAKSLNTKAYDELKNTKYLEIVNNSKNQKIKKHVITKINKEIPIDTIFFEKEKEINKLEKYISSIESVIHNDSKSIKRRNKSKLTFKTDFYKKAKKNIINNSEEAEKNTNLPNIKNFNYFMAE